MLIYLKLLMTAFFWGGTFVAGRVVSGEVGPFSAAFLRFATASLFLIPLALSSGQGLKRLTPGRWAGLLVLGMTGVFSYNVFFFKGLQLIEAGRASLIIANNPVFITLFSALIFRERLSLLGASGIVLSVAGAAVVITRGDPAAALSGGLGPGELYIFFCVLSWVAYSLVGKTVMADLSPLAAVAWAAFIGAAALAVPAGVEGLFSELPSFSLWSWIGIIYLGVFGTVLGFVWYYQGIREIGPTRAGQFINFVPVSAVFLAYLILGESISLSLVLGGALVLCGITLTNKARFNQRLTGTETKKPPQPRGSALARILVEKTASLIKEALSVSYHLFKIMIPVLVAVKILKELGLIEYLAVPLRPVMGVVGLPAEMGLVWATAMLNNIYSSIIVLLALVEDAPLNTAQATVLGTMILVAHTLPVELKIAQASGARLLFQAFVRIGGAMFIGWALNLAYSGLGVLQGPAKILVSPEAAGGPADHTLLSWAAREAMNLVSIFGIIVGLLIMMRILTRLRIIDLMNRLLRPVLGLMGIGPKASAIAIIGITLGISYGGGLIIREARSGRVDKRDVFYSLTLMGLAHSLIEDTMLMVMIGGDLSGLLWARLALALASVSCLVKLTSRLPSSFCDRFLWSKPE
ncbi:MAG: DMT family transporter [Desulfobacteraceae bacterium]